MCPILSAFFYVRLTVKLVVFTPPSPSSLTGEESGAEGPASVRVRDPPRRHDASRQDARGGSVRRSTYPGQIREIHARQIASTLSDPWSRGFQSTMDDH